MPRIIKSGLIQMSLPMTEGEGTIPQIMEAMYQKHLPLIEQAGQAGVQILCLQEIFNTPYFCPGQDKAWYASAETVPGPTTDRLAEIREKYQMVPLCLFTKKNKLGVFYNTAAVIDADGTYLGKYRKNHIPHTTGFWEKFFFKPGNLGYPVFQTRYAKVVFISVTTAISRRRARALGLNGAETFIIHLLPLKGFLNIFGNWKQPAHAAANGYFMGCINRVGKEKPWGFGRILRYFLLR